MDQKGGGGGGHGPAGSVREQSGSAETGVAAGSEPLPSRRAGAAVPDGHLAHMIARVVYAAPDQIVGMIERQDDVPDRQRGPARMGDGTVDLGFQDAATGKWLESHLCGGILFVAGLPHQAYRIVLKNRTPMPLEIGVGVDGKDLQTGGTASLRRGSLRVEKSGHAHAGPHLAGAAACSSR
jgi:hypothetical protein